MTDSLFKIRRFRLFSGLLAVGTIHCTYAGQVRADGNDPAAADTAAARALAVDGMKLAQAGRCDDAIVKLERAQKLHPAPVILEQLGECHVAIGQLVEGTEMLRKLLLEPLQPHASAAIAKAYERAQITLDGALPKIASLTITVSAPEDAKVAVEVDGQAVPSALLGAARPTNPGDRLVEATAPGYLKASAKVTLGSGVRRSIALELERDPAAPVPMPAVESAATGMAQAASPSSDHADLRAASTADTREESSSPEPSSPNHVPAYISWGVGGAALVAGATFGVLAMNGKSDLDSSCKGTLCPATSQSKIDDAKRWGTFATIGLGVGVAGVALGTVLYFTAGSGSADTAVRASRRSPGHATAHRYGPRAWLGVGELSFATDF